MPERARCKVLRQKQGAQEGFERVVVVPESVREFVKHLIRNLVSDEKAVHFAGDKLTRCFLLEDKINDVFPVPVAGLPEDSFHPFIVLCSVINEGKPLVSPASKCPGGFLDVILGVVANA